jgi:hypothetical protein
MWPDDRDPVPRELAARLHAEGDDTWVAPQASGTFEGDGFEPVPGADEQYYEEPER